MAHRFVRRVEVVGFDAGSAQVNDFRLLSKIHEGLRESGGHMALEYRTADQLKLDAINLDPKLKLDDFFVDPVGTRGWFFRPVPGIDNYMEMANRLATAWKKLMHFNLKR